MRGLLTLVTTLALAVSAVDAAVHAQTPDAAQKPAATKTAAKLAPGQKLCKSKQPSGAIKSWTCGREQPCCVNHSLNLYTCGSQLLKCF